MLPHSLIVTMKVETGTVTKEVDTGLDQVGTVLVVGVVEQEIETIIVQIQG